MDLAELWQEHKRWLMGCAAGLLVYLIGGMVIGSVYSTDAVTGEILRLQRRFQAAEMYKPEALALARREREQLDEELMRLRAALEFKPEPRFRLEGRSEPEDLHFSRVARDLQRELLDRANNLNVELARADLRWPRAVGEEIPDVLIGLALLDQAVTRLLDAHEVVVEEDPEAFGLQVIESFTVDGALAGFSRARGTGISRRREYDPASSLEEQTVSFSFRADTRTTTLFFEACRDPDNPIVLVELSVHQGQPDETLQVKGKLAAIAFREGELGTQD